MTRKKVTIDGNTACAHVAHAVNEVIAIYPITPSSPMGEISDAKSAAGKKNIFGTIPTVIEMQSEGGAAGALHGAVTTGSMTTTFTASQGLLLMIPNMYKIAGELSPTVFHVTARSLAAQALSIFGDHSDVMATRQTGFALLASNNVQEAMDFALIAHSATLESRVPFLHFFDGFRTSHEVQKVEELTMDDMKAMIDEKYVFQHRERGLSPDKPKIRGTAQNPDVYFQGRETVNKYYEKTPAIVQKAMNEFAKIAGRQYHLFDYVGAPDAEHIIIIMGSGTETIHEVTEFLNNNGEKAGCLKVRLYRPFDVKAFSEKLPATVKKIAVLDRTKEPGSIGEPLYMDIITALAEANAHRWLQTDKIPEVYGGRYGLGSKEFNAGMAKAVFNNLKENSPKNHFTIGINDDVTNSSLEWDDDFNSEHKGVHRAMFFGLGSDGTVGANKNSIKIIGENTDNYAQAYFVYDSKKAGSITTSHLRFAPGEIRSTYLINKAEFIACHNFNFLNTFDILSHASKGATFLLESHFEGDELWDNLPREVQTDIIEKELKVYYINARELAMELGLGARTNIIMQTAYFAISGILSKDKAIFAIKDAIKKTYGQKGEKVLEMNYKAVDKSLENLHELRVPGKISSTFTRPSVVPDYSPEFVKNVTARMIEGKGDSLPVSLIPDDGTYMTGTTQYEKRNIAVNIPAWVPSLCTQCAECVMVCPHATIRMKAFDPELLKSAPKDFNHIPAKGKAFKGLEFTIQIAPEDCTGCEICQVECPAFEKDENKEKTGRKALNMEPLFPIREREIANWEFFLKIPETNPDLFKPATVKGSQFLKPLFEFSGACVGCGETPYVKLLTQLFGDRAMIANATGCSSIYGGNLPTTPYTTRSDGRGPIWSNSLFEDNAEFGLGMRLNVDKKTEFARELIDELIKESASGDLKSLLEEIKAGDQSTVEGVEAQRKRITILKKRLSEMNESKAKHLLSVADNLTKKSVWILGGDGWAYDIGYGGLDHVLASGKNVNVLVVDTEVYSNTGGQMSKATPTGAVAQFAASGKPLAKKDLGMMAMAYGDVYVAQIAMGYSAVQTIKAFREAESYNGPSLIIALSHCIAWGIDMAQGMEAQRKAVNSGHTILYRYNPLLKEEGKNPLLLDSKEPTLSIDEYMQNENRYRILKKSKPEEARRLAEMHQEQVKEVYKRYSNLAKMESW